jgi:hypothetical protein
LIYRYGGNNLRYYDNDDGGDNGDHARTATGLALKNDKPNIIRTSFTNEMPYDASYTLDANNGATATIADANTSSYDNGDGVIKGIYKSLGN